MNMLLSITDEEREEIGVENGDGNTFDMVGRYASIEVHHQQYTELLNSPEGMKRVRNLALYGHRKSKDHSKEREDWTSIAWIVMNYVLQEEYEAAKDEKNDPLLYATLTGQHRIDRIIENEDQWLSRDARRDVERIRRFSGDRLMQTGTPPSDVELDEHMTAKRIKIHSFGFNNTRNGPHNGFEVRQLLRLKTMPLQIGHLANDERGVIHRVGHGTESRGEMREEDVETLRLRIHEAIDERTKEVGVSKFKQKRGLLIDMFNPTEYGEETAETLAEKHRYGSVTTISDIRTEFLRLLRVRKGILLEPLAPSE